MSDDYSDENLMRYRERWWHFGRCWRCWLRYSDWFTVRGRSYCWPCATENRSAP